jgi:uncharacterized protein
MSSHAIEEAHRNVSLRYPKAGGRLADLIGRLSVVPEGATGDFALGEDQGLGVGDAAVLAAAIFSRADLLVTGDRKHFGRLFGNRIDGVLVATITDALNLLLEAESEID